jgi:peroxiredoxin Q/BCP
MRHELLVPLSIALVVGLAAVGVACGRLMGRRQHLVPGDAVPDLEVRNQEGASLRLSHYRGHPLVVYFYPKDRTPGCTVEAQAFRADYPKFKALGVEILGVSNDDVASHQDFCTKQALPFPLLADPDQAIARAFGVKALLGFYQRITFVLDRDGVVRRVFDPVRPLGHAREVLGAVRELP